SALHAASVRAYDARPGAREILADRLDIMLREQRYAAERSLELGELLTAADPDTATAAPDRLDGIRLELAWARDDQERATARCAELRARMAELDRHTGYVGTVWPQPATAATVRVPEPVARPEPVDRPEPEPEHRPEPEVLARVPVQAP
ncbi:hypothetical protein P8605_50120, partial [Streptomyces sp. T-3]|nr:hypothetical protein [Streptomyces sp. T-3]